MEIGKRWAKDGRRSISGLDRRTRLLVPTSLKSLDEGHSPGNKYGVCGIVFLSTAFIPGGT